jgi:hypothetical protein
MRNIPKAGSPRRRGAFSEISTLSEVEGERSIAAFIVSKAFAKL